MICCYPEGEDADKRRCRRVQKEVLQNFNCLADFVTDMGVRVGERGLSDVYVAVIAIRSRRRLFNRPSPRWNYRIKMDVIKPTKPCS